MSAQNPAVNNIKGIKNKATVDSVVGWQLPLLLVLFASVVFVAIKTVVHRHETRTAYMELQKLEKERDKLAAQWSRLKLEQGTTLNQVRVEQYARWDLKMEMPKAAEIRMVRESVNIELGSDAIAAEIQNNNKSSAMNDDKQSKVALGD